MDPSVFMDKASIPTDKDLRQALGIKYELWMEIRAQVFQKYPDGKEEWNFPGKKYGWSFRIKDKKRAIIYFLPGEEEFRVAFVFGGKAFEAIKKSEISPRIVSELESAKIYAEGRGIRIPVSCKAALKDIFSLIDIKLAH